MIPWIVSLIQYSKPMNQLQPTIATPSSVDDLVYCLSITTKPHFMHGELATVNSCIFYSINIKPVSLRTNSYHSSTILDNLLPFGFPWHIRKNITNNLLEKLGISDSLTYATSKITETSKCYFTKKSPTSTLGWSPAYISDHLNKIQKICAAKTSYLQSKLATENISENNGLCFTVGS